MQMQPNPMVMGSALQQNAGNNLSLRPDCYEQWRIMTNGHTQARSGQQVSGTNLELSSSQANTSTHPGSGLSLGLRPGPVRGEDPREHNHTTQQQRTSCDGANDYLVTGQAAGGELWPVRAHNIQGQQDLSDAVAGSSSVKLVAQQWPAHVSPWPVSSATRLSPSRRPAQCSVARLCIRQRPILTRVGECPCCSMQQGRRWHSRCCHHNGATRLLDQCTSRWCSHGCSGAIMARLGIEHG